MKSLISTVAARENDYTHTDEMYINFVDADGDALTVTKAFDSYTVSPNPYPYDAYARHTGAPYGNLAATIEETTSNDGGEWRVNLTYTVEDSDLDILADGEVVNQLYTISVSDGAASFSTELRVQLYGRLDIYAADDFATINEGASISVNAGETLPNWPTPNLPAPIARLILILFMTVTFIPITR